MALSFNACVYMSNDLIVHISKQQFVTLPCFHFSLGLFLPLYDFLLPPFPDYICNLQTRGNKQKEENDEKDGQDICESLSDDDNSGFGEACTNFIIQVYVVKLMKDFGNT